MRRGRKLPGDQASDILDTVSFDTKVEDPLLDLHKKAK
jgi:hypothetical protein